MDDKDKMSLIAKLLDDHKRIYPHHSHLCELCKEAEAAIAAPAAPLPELTGPSEAFEAARKAYVLLTNSGKPTDSGGAEYTASTEMMVAFDGLFELAAYPSPAPAPTDPKGGLDIDDVIAELGIADEVAAIRSSTAPARQQEPDPDDSGPPCATCGGHGIVSHFVHNESAPGYEDSPCPDCSVETAPPGASIGDDPTFKRMLWMVAQDWTRSDRQIALTCYIDRIIDQRGAQ